MKKIKKYIHKIKKNKFYKSLLKNSFWAFAGDMSASILNLVVTIFLIKLIGNNDYGILVLAQSYMQIVDVSLNVQCWKGVIQYGQKCLIQKNINKLNEYIKLGILLDLITAILGGLVSYFLANLIGNIFDWSNEMIIFSKIFSFTIFSHLSGTSTAILRIFDKFYLVAIQKFLTSLIKLIVIMILFFYLGKVSLITATIVYCFTDIIGNILLVIFALIIYLKKTKLSNILKSNIPKDFKKFISFTLWSTLGDIVDIPVNYFDVFIISLLGNELVSVFKVFKQCVAMVKKVTSAVQQAIMPQFSELSALGMKAKGYQIVLKIRNIILKVMIPITLIIGILSPIWLELFYGKLYASYWYVLAIYLLIQIIALSYTAIHPFYISLNKPKRETIFVLISNIIYMIIAYILIRKIGMLGIVIGFSIQCFIVIYFKIVDIKKEIKN